MLDIVTHFFAAFFEPLSRRFFNPDNALGKMIESYFPESY